MNQTLTHSRPPLGLLRDAVEASREIDRARAASDAVKKQLDAANALVDAAIERRGPILDEIVRRMKEAGATVVTFYDGPSYWAVTREEDQATLSPCHMPPALATTCEAGGGVRFDGAHAALGDEERVDPFPPFRSINPIFAPLPKEFPEYRPGDNLSDRDLAEFERDRTAAKAAWDQVFPREGDDLPDEADDSEAAMNAVLDDLDADDANMHVRPSLSELARSFAVPDDDGDLFDAEKTGEYPTASLVVDEAAEEAVKDVA